MLRTATSTRKSTRKARDLEFFSGFASVAVVNQFWGGSRVLRDPPFFHVTAATEAVERLGPQVHGWNDKMTTNRDNRSSADVIGVLFEAQRLVGCRAIKTMFGRVRYRRACVAIVDHDIDEALTTLLRELGVSYQSLPIAAAIPTDECYFATRPIASGAAKASPRVLLRESLRSSAARLDRMAIDVVHWQPDRRLVAGICAAPIDRVEQIRTAVAKSKHSLQRLEPAAGCLIGVSPEREGRERRSVLTTRVLLGESTLLAVMSRGEKPIHWQCLPLPPGDEATGIVSAIRSLETAANACGLDRTPDTVIVHGRSELQSLTDQSWLDESLHGSFRWVDSPSLAGEDIAQALADRLLANEDEGFDLVRQHRDPLLLRRVVPYKEIVAYTLAAVLLAGLLWSRLDSVRMEKTALVSVAPPMIAEGTNPSDEKNLLISRTSAVSQFLDRRIRWSGLLAEITQALPDGMRLTSIHGSAPMPKKGKRASKVTPETLIVKAECAVNEDGSMPQSLEGLAEHLHSLDTVRTRFDMVELSDVRRTSKQSTDIVGAAFSVIFTTKTQAR